MRNARAKVALLLGARFAGTATAGFRERNLHAGMALASQFWLGPGLTPTPSDPRPGANLGEHDDQLVWARWDQQSTHPLPITGFTI